MLTIGKLEQYGAKSSEGLARCFGNEGLYLRLVGTVPTEGNFAKLHTALEENNLDAAFEAAHALKGVLANLSLTPLLEPVEKMTELLRTRSQADYMPLLEEVDRQKEALRAICED